MCGCASMASPCKSWCVCACHRQIPPTKFTKFWTIWCPEANTPTKKHYNMTDAVAECERLAKQCPGKHFYLLSALDIFEATAVTRTALK